MDIVNQPSHPATAPEHTGQRPSGQKKLKGRGMRVLSVIVLTLAALIVGLVALYLAIGGTKEEQTYVDKDKFQAVFLNGGQVYFGKVQTLNGKFVTLNNIYYLRVNQQVQPNQSTSSSTAQDVSLAKLGCELHGPTDIMVINREQVLFWENLKDDGQVAKAIATYVKNNPNGQTCDTAATDTTKQ